MQAEFDLDAIDREILQSILEHPGQNATAIFRPFLKLRAESTFRRRLRTLEIFGYIRSEKGVGEVCYFPEKKIEMENANNSPANNLYETSYSTAKEGDGI